MGLGCARELQKISNNCVVISTAHTTTPPPNPASYLSVARVCGAVMPKRSLMVLAPVLGGGAMLVFGVSLLSIFWPNPIFTNIWL